MYEMKVQLSPTSGALSVSVKANQLWGLSESNIMHMDKFRKKKNTEKKSKIWEEWNKLEAATKHPIKLKLQRKVIEVDTTVIEQIYRDIICALKKEKEKDSNENV